MELNGALEARSEFKPSGCLNDFCQRAAFFVMVHGGSL
jgi:hypothetical protein